jgi:hypothetical protein
VAEGGRTTRSTRSSLLAAVALTVLASQPVAAAAPELGYPMPTRWSPAKRNSNNRREESEKRHARSKAAYKSKRAQRKQAKR